MSKILVISTSNSNFVEQMKKDLQSSGIEIVSSEDGIESLRLIRQKKPPLALVEDNLPRLDGYKLTRLLKFDSKFRRIKIFIITTAIMEETQELSQAVGAEGILAMNDINIVDKVKSYYSEE